MKALGIKNMAVVEIEKVLSIYPWFAFARKELLLKMSAMGEEYRNEALRRTNLYIYPEKEPFIQSYVTSVETVSTPESVDFVYELDYFDSISIEESIKGQNSYESQTHSADSSQVQVEQRGPLVSEQENKPRIYVVGGDYFSNSDFEGLSKDGIDSFVHLSASSIPASQNDFVASEFNDELFYTETLAEIYAQQELYERAIEVYDKLILLYPEKSAYFATLKSEIKKHL